MHIAILMANTDESAFSARHPRDGEKFRALLAPLRPDWRFSVFPVKDGEFPEARDRIDGFIITGSPASARSDEDWVLDLMELVREIVRVEIPLFGACFGHQLIARALGGAVGDNPGAFVLGNVETDVIARPSWMVGAPPRFRIAAAHAEQVTTLPNGARVLTVSDGCLIGGFAIGNHVFTTEYHPEMTPDFIAALTEALARKLPPEVIDRARASLNQSADRALFAQWIVGFFEQAASVETPSRT